MKTAIVILIVLLLSTVVSSASNCNDLFNISEAAYLRLERNCTSARDRVKTTYVCSQKIHDSINVNLQDIDKMIDAMKQAKKLCPALSADFENLLQLSYNLKSECSKICD